MREIYDRFMDVLRDIDINSLTYEEMEQVARICSTVKILREKTFTEKYLEMYGDKCCCPTLSETEAAEKVEKLSD